MPRLAFSNSDRQAAGSEQDQQDDRSQREGRWTAEVRLALDARFKSFRLNSSAYCSVIESIYQYYKLVYSISEQIDKLNNWFIENVARTSKDFEGFDCYKRMFMKYVYNEKIISEFINHIVFFLRNNSFFALKFEQSFTTILEVQDSLNKL